MQAIVFEQTGPPEQVLALRETSTPRLGAGEVLIEVRARCMQPADLLFIAGRYRVQPRFPQIAGFDAAGVVVDVGDGVDGFSPGQRVAFRYPGAWAEFAAVPATKVYPVPALLSDTVPDELACQFALNPPTAWGLLDVARPASGARILATAGRSAVVRLLAAFARPRGIVLQRLVRQEGAYALLHGERDEVISRGASVADALNGHPNFDAVLDAVGGPSTLDLIAATVPRGRLISYGILDDQPFELRTSTVLQRNLVWQGFGIDAWMAGSARARLAIAFAECWALLASEPELLPIAGRFALKDIKRALQAQHDNRAAGKILLT